MYYICNIPDCLALHTDVPIHYRRQPAVVIGLGQSPALIRTQVSALGVKKARSGGLVQLFSAELYKSQLFPLAWSLAIYEPAHP